MEAFEAHPADPAGIVAFVTPASFLTGKAFAGMREYLRRVCGKGWIIQLSPEGNRPRMDTRIFGADVGRQLCIAVFARCGEAQPEQPALVRSLELTGKRQTKLDQLRRTKPNDPRWSTCETEWNAPFLPHGNPDWASYPQLCDLMPWTSRGVTTGRNWVYAPDSETLERRWKIFTRAGEAARRELFGESRDRQVTSRVGPLPGFPARDTTLAADTGPLPTPIRVAFRSFDRQWLIPDNRLMVVPRPPLWTVRSQYQIYATEQSTQAIESGPGLTFSALIPDINHYNARSGRVLPLYRDPNGRLPNVAPHLLQVLSYRLEMGVSGEELLAYIAGVIGHPGYTRRFLRDLQRPGVRVPLTANPDLWKEAVRIGTEVIWLHTFGERSVTTSAVDCPRSVQDLVEATRITIERDISDAIGHVPDEIRYDQSSQTLYVGAGEIRPVSKRTWEYDVGGMRVISHWFDYRSKNPKHKRRSSSLDNENCRVWSRKLTDELLAVLAVLQRCVDLEPLQNDILGSICEGPLIKTTDLEIASVLPVPAYARKPPALDDDRGSHLF